MKKIINNYANYTVAFYGPADLVVKKANINKARFSPSLIVEDGLIKKFWEFLNLLFLIF